MATRRICKELLETVSGLHAADAVDCKSGARYVSGYTIVNAPKRRRKIRKVPEFIAE